MAREKNNKSSLVLIKEHESVRWKKTPLGRFCQDYKADYRLYCDSDINTYRIIEVVYLGIFI